MWAETRPSFVTCHSAWAWWWLVPSARHLVGENTQIVQHKKKTKEAVDHKWAYWPSLITRYGLNDALPDS